MVKLRVVISVWMSFAELKEQVAQLAPDERLKLARFIAGLEGDSPSQEFRRVIDQRMKAMDTGRKVTMKDFERRHQDRVAKK